MFSFSIPKNIFFLCISLLVFSKNSFSQENRNEVEIIRDSKKAQKIKSDILLKKAEVLLQKRSEFKGKSTTEHYKLGDKREFDEIVSTLQRGTEEARIETLKGLQKKYNDPENYTITEPDLKKVILACLEYTNLEPHAIQLAGICKIDGYISSFENRLYSGKSVDENRLLYWLSLDGRSEKGIDFLENKLLQANKQTDKYYMLVALDQYGENPSKTYKTRVGKIALQLLQKDSFAFDYLKNICEVIALENGDAKIIPIAKSNIAKSKHIEESLLALWRLTNKNSKLDIKNCVLDESSFYEALPAVQNYFMQFKDTSLVNEVFTTFEKRREISDFDIYKIVKFIHNIHADSLVIHPEIAFVNPEIIEKIKAYHQYEMLTIKDIADDIYKFGLIKKPINSEKIDLIKFKNYSLTDQVYQLLEIAEILTVFDVETEAKPVPYNLLLEKISTQTDGNMNRYINWMEVIFNQNKGKYMYAISSFFKDKAYRFTPEDKGQEYNTEDVLNFLNVICNQADFKEKFYFINEKNESRMKILFVQKEKWNSFCQKYKLTTQIK